MTVLEMLDAVEAANEAAIRRNWEWHVLDCISLRTVEMELARLDAYDAYAAAHAYYLALCRTCAEMARRGPQNAEAVA